MTYTPQQSVAASHADATWNVWEAHTTACRLCWPEKSISPDKHPACLEGRAAYEESQRAQQRLDDLLLGAGPWDDEQYD